MASYKKSPKIGGISFNYSSSYWGIELMQDLFAKSRINHWSVRLKLEKYWKLVSIVANVLEKEYKAPYITHEGIRHTSWTVASGPSTNSFLAFNLVYDDRDEANEVLYDFKEKFYNDFKSILAPNIIYDGKYGWEPDLNPTVVRNDNKFHMMVSINMPCDINDNAADDIIEKYKDFIGEVKLNDRQLTPIEGVNQIRGNWALSPMVDDTQFHYYVDKYGQRLEDIIRKIFNGDTNELVYYSGCGVIHTGKVSIKQYYKFLTIMWNYFKEMHKGKYKMALMSTSEYDEKLESPSWRDKDTFYMSICVFTDTIEEAEEFLNNFIESGERDIKKFVLEYRVIPGTTIPGCNFSSNMVEFFLAGVGEYGIYQDYYLRLKRKIKHLLYPIETIKPESKNFNEDDNIFSSKLKELSKELATTAKKALKRFIKKLQ